ncbi:MAG: PAS domain-containing sensor histidine kinase [Candidatus Blackburnbacteria bacterium]|nr:PAS domain-containing sensor histidine kinase [Candidatus Blackburnbacteria bacterium]
MKTSPKILTEIYKIGGELYPTRTKGERASSDVLTPILTSRVQTKKELLGAEERLRLVLEAASLGTWRWNVGTNKVEWSTRLELIHGFVPGTFKGTLQAYLRRIQSEDRQSVAQSLKQAIQKGADHHVEYRIALPDGKYRWVEEWGKLFLDKLGKSSHMLGVCMDITSRKEENKQKDNFIGIASHELKTPLASIKAFTYILQKRLEKQNDQSINNYLYKIDEKLNTLTKLINDLVDITRIGANKLELFKEQFFIDELVQEVIQDIQPVTPQHTITKSGKGNVKVYADRMRIGQVMANLLKNAIKYSPNAKRVHVSITKSQRTLTVGVRDFGVGIRKRDLKKVFDLFFRGSGREIKQSTGLGVGLYISSEIITQHGGKIWTESTFGKGSIFYFTLPLVK